MLEKGSFARGIVDRPLNGSPTSNNEISSLEDLERKYGVGILRLAEDGFVEMGVLKRGQMRVQNPPVRHEYHKVLPDGKIITLVSQARYWVEMNVDGHLLKVSSMPENSEATEHLHLYGITEHYDVFAGSAHLMLEKGTIDLGENNRRYTVEEGEVHKFTTNSSGAITSLLMENAGKIDPDKLHIFPDPRRLL